MPERKKSRSSELRKVFLAYESAMSPLVLPLVLGFFSYWICKTLNQPIIMPIIIGSSIGFIIGLRRLLLFLKQTNQESNKSLNDEDKNENE